MKKANATKWELERALQVAREALSLLDGRQQVLEPRLDPGLVQGLQADLPALEALKSGRPAKVLEVKGLTGTQADHARAGAEWLSAVREAVKRRSAGAGIRRAVGVGKGIHAKQVALVAAGIEAVLALAREQPGALRACGILDSDIENGRALLSSLTGAHTEQREGLVAKKNLTDVKNATQARLEAAVEAISTAGYLHYLSTDRPLARRFRGLIPSSGGGNGEGGEEDGQSGAGAPPAQTKG